MGQFVFTAEGKQIPEKMLSPGNPIRRERHTVAASRLQCPCSAGQHVSLGEGQGDGRCLK